MFDDPAGIPADDPGEPEARIPRNGGSAGADDVLSDLIGESISRPRRAPGASWSARASVKKTCVFCTNVLNGRHLDIVEQHAGEGLNDFLNVYYTEYQLRGSEALSEILATAWTEFVLASVAEAPDEVRAALPAMAAGDFLTCLRTHAMFPTTRANDALLEMCRTAEAVTARVTSMLSSGEVPTRELAGLWAILSRIPDLMMRPPTKTTNALDFKKRPRITSTNDGIVYLFNRAPRSTNPFQSTGEG